MAKIKLGAKPKTFKPITVKFELPDGTPGEIQATYKYRTRSEFGAFLNTIFSEAGETPPEDGKPNFERLFQISGDRHAHQILKSLEAWDMEDELNLENLQALSDEVPAAAVALMSSYAAACTEGRLGN